ncbi:MAG: leucyl aminopeptidase [Pseudomonadota bacterium]|nr:leucyl aminopeptidase [Pseudomonadota bacterium]
MEYGAKSGNPEKQRVPCIVVGVFERRKPSAALERIDQVSDGYIGGILRRGDMDGKAGQTLLVHNVPNTLCDRVLLVGCGRERDFDDERFRQATRAAVRALNRTGTRDAISYLTDLNVRGRDVNWKVKETVIHTEEASYRFDRFKTKEAEPEGRLRSLIMGLETRRDLAAAEQAIDVGVAISKGVSLARDLGNLPGNVCTPSYLADQGLQLAKDLPAIETKVLDESDMEALGMGALLSVAKGSEQPAKLIVMEYTGTKDGSRPYVLVGKGVTFDSGGISIKPAAAMDEMKYDMCGAASVLGSLLTVATLKLPINVIGIIPSSENLPDGKASKPGDIVTSMSGKTIEILNTDAEGRLLLCDALTYAQRYEPVTIIDIATLTGACVVALGHHATGLFSNTPALTKALLHAGEATGDRAWELPVWSAYQKQLDSPFADMANVGGRDAGSITAACFLSRFVEDDHWAHLDIAGTAWHGGKRKNATGRPVLLLTEYLMNQVDA